MKIKNEKKVLASIVIATYLAVYAVPAGMCASAVPQIDAGIQKPALRGASQPSSLKLEGDISITKKNPKISLSLRNSDVKQVLRMFADKAGLNIIFHSSVDTAGSSSSSGNSSGSANTSPKVTLDLVNVPLNDAFKMVMQVSGLTYYLDHNTIIVASAAAAQSLNLAKQELMTIPVKYADASALADFLNKNIFSINKPGLSNAQIAVTNPSANEILIFGTKNDYLMAKKVIAQFDVKPLEETFIVNHTTPKEMADLLCNVLFKNKGTSSTGSSSSSGSSTGLALGAGVVACQFNGSSPSTGSGTSTGSISSLNNTALSVTYFAERGTISVMGGSTEQMDLIKDFIAKNDKKQPQAYLEVSLIELNESGMREFDNNWKVYSDFFSGGFNGTTATDPNYPTFFQGDQLETVHAVKTFVADPIYKVVETTPATILQKYAGAPTLTYAINYLIQNQKGRVLANPRIMITNGQNSTIDLSSDYVKTVTSQIVTTSGSLTPTVQRTYAIGNDEGIKVDLMPFISPEGYVTLNIKPVYSTIKEKVYAPSASGTGNDLQATLLQRRNLDLKNVRIKDGETLIIGGMIRENETKNVSKFPVLGDLPGVGMFFRNTSTTKEKEELVIMITPKIIKESEDIVNNTGTAL